MSAKTIDDMTSDEIFEAVNSGMAEIAHLLETGQINRAGRFTTDAELAGGVGTGGRVALSRSSEKASAA